MCWLSIELYILFVLLFFVFNNSLYFSLCYKFIPEFDSNTKCVYIPNIFVCRGSGDTDTATVDDYSSRRNRRRDTDENIAEVNAA